MKIFVRGINFFVKTLACILYIRFRRVAKIRLMSVCLRFKLIVVWVESNFNGPVLLCGFVWFGGKWGKMSTSLVWSGTARIWGGFGSDWNLKLLITESDHANFPAIR